VGEKAQECEPVPLWLFLLCFIPAYWVVC